MSALIKAAKKEGHVNVITIPLSGWANYGAIMKDFTKKYGIKINDAEPQWFERARDHGHQQRKGSRRTSRTWWTWERATRPVT